jgi:hypothetical protein
MAGQTLDEAAGGSAPIVFMTIAGGDGTFMVPLPSGG